MNDNRRDDDTPQASPAHKPGSDTEYNLAVPFDPQWFHSWRRELRSDMRDIKDDLEAAKIAATRLDQRLDGLYESIKRVERDVKDIDTRVVTLEDRAAEDAGFRKVSDNSLTKQFKSGVASRLGDMVVYGLGFLFIWMLYKFFQEYRP